MALDRNRLVNQFLRVGKRAVRRWVRDQSRSGRTRTREQQFEQPTPRDQERQHEQATRRDREQQFETPPASGDYPGDFIGTPEIDYAPVKDDQADPGEVVWTWVPYEEDYSQGKDRPVLIIGHDGPWLLALQVSTTNDPEHRAREARYGRHWVDIGAGGWDHQGRESEARVNRTLRIDPDGIRRVGARLDQERFLQVAREVLRHN